MAEHEAAPHPLARSPRLIKEAALNYAEALAEYQKSGPVGTAPTMELSERLTHAGMALTNLVTGEVVIADLQRRLDDTRKSMVELVDGKNRLAGEVSGLLAERRQAMIERNLGIEAKEALTIERNRLAAKCEELQQKLDSTPEGFRELEAFKRKVVQVAEEYAKEHGWCSVIDEALDELGLKRAPTSYTAQLTIQVSFTGVLATRRDLPSDNWVESSVGTGAIEEAIRGAFGLASDEDHEGGSIDNISFNVDDVEEVS